MQWPDPFWFSCKTRILFCKTRFEDWCYFHVSFMDFVLDFLMIWFEYIIINRLSSEFSMTVNVVVVPANFQTEWTPRKGDVIPILLPNVSQFCQRATVLRWVTHFPNKKRWITPHPSVPLTRDFCALHFYSVKLSLLFSLISNSAWSFRAGVVFFSNTL